jgi:hypothetical protein
MNIEIKKEYWREFFESLSKRRFEWKTKIEVLNIETGDQILSAGLQLNGITVEQNGETTILDISVGAHTDQHQTHNIKKPAKITFVPAQGHHGDLINVEESNGTYTLITFIEPIGLLAGFFEMSVAAAAG